ncbi:MAG: site-specific DNA-methyltransferase [Acidimicrobiia bacterium]|nr:site-specific DNA-methyltransferase [Acidimicrobiia bacterium]
MTTTPTPSRWRYRRAATETTVPRELPLGTIVTGDALKLMQRLPPASIDCVITSPPYHQLRRYNAGSAEVGTETHIDEYVDRLVELCDEAGRVLTSSGGLWLNLGDSFSRGTKWGAAPKSLLLAPERLLIRLAGRGWILRNKIVWAKPNPMPNSVRDRLSTTWEPMFFLVRARRYFLDLDAIREPHKTTRKPGPLKTDAKYGGVRPPWAGPLAGANDGLEKTRAAGRPGHPLGKNPGDVWTIATAGYRGAHFAVFPEELVRRPILAGCPERVSVRYAAPWEREPRRDRLGDVVASCDCTAGWRAGRVLDPFMGSGTVAIAAERNGRDWIGIELNPAFTAMARARVEALRRRTTTNERRIA